MPDFTQKLTREFIENAVNYYEGLWGSSHINWRDTDSYISGTNDIWSTFALKRSRQSYHPSTARTKVEDAVDALLALDPTIKRTPMRDSETSRQRADKVEFALSKIVQDSFSQEIYIPSRQLGRNLVAYNTAILEAPVLDGGVMAKRPKAPKQEAGEDPEEFKKRKAVFEAEKRTFNPVRFRVPHPSSVLFDPETRNPPLVIKNMTMLASALHELSKQKVKTRKNARVFPMKGNDDFTEIDVQDIWTDNWHVVKESGSDIIYQERNTWGFKPFIPSFGGFGHQNSDDDLEMRTQGILDPIKESLVRQAQNYSAKHHILMIHAYRPMGTRQDAAEMAAQLGSDSLIEMEPEDLFVVDFPDVSSSLFESGREIESDINLGTFDPSFSGTRSAGVSTVGQQAILTEAQQRKFATTVRSMEFMFTMALRRLLWLIDTQNISFMGITKEDIEGNYDVTVRFGQINLAANLSEREIGLRELELGVISTRTYLERAGIENVTEEKRRVLQDKIEAVPGIMEKIAEPVAEEIGLGEEFNEVISQDEQTELPTSGFNISQGGTRNGRVRDALTGAVQNPGRNGVG